MAVSSRRCWQAPTGEVTPWVYPEDLPMDVLEETVDRGQAPSGMAPVEWIQDCYVEYARRRGLVVPELQGKPA